MDQYQKELKERINLDKYEDQLVLLRGPTEMGVNFSNLLEEYDSSSKETAPGEIFKAKD